MPRKRKVFSWTCMGCFRVMAKMKGSRERLCTCAKPIPPKPEEVTEKPT